MTEALATLFEGKEIRIQEHEGSLWFPLKDLSLALGLDRTTLRNHVERNKEMFEGCTALVDKKSSSDLNEELLSVNEEGIYLLLARISTGRLKNPQAKETIHRFRKETSRLIQRYRKREIVQVPDGTALETELCRAIQIASLTGADKAIMQAAALRKCGLKEYADALVPALTHGESDQWMNATQIGNRCGHSAREVNNYLEWHRFQYRGQDGIWRLTDAGEQHGEEYWFESPQKHREIRIRWRSSILAASGLIRDNPGETLAKV